MGKDSNVGLGIIMVIIAIALFGGSQGSGNNGLFSSASPTPEQKQAQIQQQLNTTQSQVTELQKQVQIEQDKKTKSEYNGVVDMQFVNHSNDPSQEFISIRVNNNTTIKSIPVSGWKIKSLTSGNSVTIPKGTYLYFSGTVNGEQDIYLAPNDALFLTTGISPNGSSFKVNKCSGYLNQFQTFTPYLGGYCPAPRNEDLSSIPRTGYNDACFDYIDNMPSCRIQTDTLPAGYGKWSSECTDFIYKKINYPSCVDTHKNDKDFYQPEWRVFLKRSETLWKNSREDIVLYDLDGKIVDEIKY